MFRKASTTWNLGSELSLGTWQPLTQGEPDSWDHLESSSRGQARSTRPSTKWRALGSLEHRLFLPHWTDEKAEARGPHLAKCSWSLRRKDRVLVTGLGHLPCTIFTPSHTLWAYSPFLPSAEKPKGGREAGGAEARESWAAPVTVEALADSKPSPGRRGCQKD